MNIIKALAIETSCDDTSVAIVDSNKQILSNLVYNQFKEHEAFSGVVPEIAARSHITHLSSLINQALSESNLTLDEIDIIASTGGPGLIGGIIVGTMLAKALSSAKGKPFLAINHLEGHALTVRLTEDIEFPYLLLLVSGGHCQFIEVGGTGKYNILGETLDDAVGEAFDKVGRMLNLGYPSGPIIENYARIGDKNRFKFPLSMTERPGCDMSFSGLKSAVRRAIEKLTDEERSQQTIYDICASFQETVALILQNRLKNAIEIYLKTHSKKQFVIAGGVASNLYIREKLKTLLNNYGFSLHAPPVKLCTDNAAMIAWVAIERFKLGKVSKLNFNPVSVWPLNELS